MSSDPSSNPVLDSRREDLVAPRQHVRLLPHNEAYAPIPGDDATILGRVVTVLRKL